MTTRPEADARQPGGPSVGELLSDISADISTLIRQEVELAKAELRQSATQAGKGAGLLGGATIFGHLAVLFLAISAWWALGNEIGRGWSALIVTVVLAVIAAVLAMQGRKEMQAVSGMPATAATIQKIPDAVKGNDGSMR